MSLQPRDREAEREGRRRRRRRGVAIGAAVALVAGIGIAELTVGLVSRVIDATGWTCGRDWDRMAEADVAQSRLVRWGTPEAREHVDPADFADLLPGLAEPSLTTEAFSDSGAYDPLLYPLGEGVVLQTAGDGDNTWVGADAVTGEPLWGISESEASGFSTVQGRFSLLFEREDERTDLVTFDARSGERLSCLRLDGSILDMTGVGGSEVVVALAGDGYRLVRLDPVAGEVVWSEPVGIAPSSIHAEGDVIAVSSSSIGRVATSWPTSQDPSTPLLGLDARTGQEVWHRPPDTGQRSAICLVPLPDGGTGTLLLEIADQREWEEGRGAYTLLDQSGEVVWSVPASVSDSAQLWAIEGVVVVQEEYRPIGLDVLTGERLWEAEGGGQEDDVGLLTTEAGTVVVLADQRVETDGGEITFVTDLIDPVTGETARHDVPLRSVRITDAYVLASTGSTQIVIPLAP